MSTKTNIAAAAVLLAALAAPEISFARISVRGGVS
jgi:hypothetical protein